MSKHTPGKWTTRKGLTAGREVVSLDAPKTKQVIARCGGPDRNENSDLIAAAPDLLEALELIVREQLVSADGSFGKVIFAAIARAKGEA